MKFKIEKAGFSSFLQLTKDVMAKTHILIEVNENDVLVRGMKLDSVCYVEKRFKITNLTKEIGSFCVDYEDFARRIKILDKEFIIEVDSVVRMRSGGKSILIPLIPEDVVRSMPDVAYEETIHIHTEKLLLAIEKTREFASQDTLRPVLQAINFKFSEDNILTTVATDSIHLSELKTIIEGAYEAEFMIMASTLKILKYLFSEDSELTMLLGEQAVYFANENTIYMTRILNGKYPAYQALFPANTTAKIGCSKKELSNAVANASISCSDSTRRVVLNVVDDYMEVLGSRDGENKQISQKVACIASEDIAIGFDHKRLENILKHYEQDDVVIDILASSKPVVIKEDNHRMLIMPIARS